MNRRWFLMVSILAGAAAPGCQQPQSGMPKPPDPVAVYDLPITKVVTDYEEFPGYTDSPRSVNVRARVSGYMTNVYFKDGSMVHEGDKLFEIDPRPYKADRDRAKGTVEQLEAHRRRVEKSYNRSKNLLARGSVSPEEYDQYEADFKETVANIEVARANLDLAELSLRWTEILAPSDGQLSRRMVDPGNLVKADDTILTSIVRLDPIWVYFDVDEISMLKIKRLMQEGKIKVQAQGDKAVPVRIGLSDEKDFPHEGVVDFTDNRVDANTGTLHFRATIANPPDAHGNRFIVPGLFVRVRLQIGDPHKALLVREQALVTDQGNKKVWVVRPKLHANGQPMLDDNRQPEHFVEMRDVVLGMLLDGYREIKKGIEAGDWVVVEGMQRLRPNGLVKEQPYHETRVAGPSRPQGGEQAKAQPSLAAGTNLPSSAFGSPLGGSPRSDVKDSAAPAAPAADPATTPTRKGPLPSGPKGIDRGLPETQRGS
jgi:multidrug efflux system membrane fusion protein